MTVYIRGDSRITIGIIEDLKYVYKSKYTSDTRSKGGSLCEESLVTKRFPVITVNAVLSKRETS